MYITKEEYVELYEQMDDRLFKQFSFEAGRMMDIHTTGIDNVKKLKRFFPTDEYNAEAVKRCAAKLIDTMHQIHKSEISIMEAQGYETTDHGLRGRVITSEASGNESISYSTGKSSESTAVDAAVKDKTARNRMLAGIVLEYLRGVEDDNGVSLLYMGMYPRRYLC